MTTIKRQSKWERRMLPISLAYLPLVAAGAVLSITYGVGAHPGGGPKDMFLKGTALVPPLFLPGILVAASAAARGSGLAGGLAKAMVGLVGLAFTAGSTLNLPNDIEAAKAAGSPVELTVGNGAVHLILGITLLVHSVLSIKAQRQPK